VNESSSPDFHARVDRFSVFSSTVVLWGWLHAPGRTLTRLVLDVSGLPEVEVEIGRPSPDVAALLGAQAGNVRFYLHQIQPVTAKEAYGARLVATFADGGSVVVNDLGRRDMASDPAHGLFGRFLGMLAERERGALLEIGSRSRSGNVRRDMIPRSWAYTGMDIVAGPNVDVVGDAHRLSHLFAPGTFDAVLSISVVEHLLMPWKVAVELNRVLAPGGLGFFFTHHCWPLHEEPWDFWRYSSHTWKALFNRRTGFEIVATAMGEPAFIVPERITDSASWGESISDYLASAVLFRKTGEATVDWDVELDEILDDGYPGVTSVPPAG
jgi:SAM-dependent methyltransferase